MISLCNCQRWSTTLLRSGGNLICVLQFYSPLTTVPSCCSLEVVSWQWLCQMHPHLQGSFTKCGFNSCRPHSDQGNTYKPKEKYKLSIPPRTHTYTTIHTWTGTYSIHNFVFYKLQSLIFSVPLWNWVLFQILSIYGAHIRSYEHLTSVTTKPFVTLSDD